MPRMYLRVPTSTDRTSSPVHRYFFADDTMLDFDMEIKCATCKHWFDSFGSATGVGVGRCNRMYFSTSGEFGCTHWEQRVTQKYSKTLQTGDTTRIGLAESE